MRVFRATSLGHLKRRRLGTPQLLHLAKPAGLTAIATRLAWLATRRISRRRAETSARLLALQALPYPVPRRGPGRLVTAAMAALSVLLARRTTTTTSRRRAAEWPEMLVPAHVAEQRRAPRPAVGAAGTMVPAEVATAVAVAGRCGSWVVDARAAAGRTTCVRSSHFFTHNREKVLSKGEKTVYTTCA